MFPVIILLVITILSIFINVFNPHNIFFYTDILCLSTTASIIMPILLFILVRRVKRLKVNIIDISLLIFYLYIIIQNSYMLPVKLTQEKFIFITLSFLIYFILKHIFEYEQKNNYVKYPDQSIAITVSILIMVPVTISILQLFLPLPIISKDVPVIGGFKNPGEFAIYLTALFPFLFTFLSRNEKCNKALKILLFTVLILSVICLLILNSRTSWIALCISALYIIISNPDYEAFVKKILNIKGSKKIFITSFTILCLLVFAYLLYMYKKDSADGRMLIWKVCSIAILDKPIFGHGFDSFLKTQNDYQAAYFQYNPFDSQNGLLSATASYAFNDYLQIITELGIIGFFIFMVSVFLIIKKPGKEVLETNNILFRAPKACIFSILICALFSYPFQSPSVYFLFFVCAAYISSSYKPLFIFSNLNKRFYIILVLLVGLSSLIGYNRLKQTYYTIKWKGIDNLYINKKFDEVFTEFSLLYPKMQDNFDFLYNYGACLNVLGKYKESLIILYKANSIRSNYDLSLCLGNNCCALEMNGAAEEHYLYCSNLIPHRFIPKYKLFKLYLDTNQKDKAYKMAGIINKMPIKIYSDEVGIIKKEAFEYLKSTVP